MNMEYKVLISETEHTAADIQSAYIERPLFDELGIGNACEAQLKIVFRPLTEVSKMARIVPYALVDAEWEQLGVFFADERSSTPSGVMTIIAYDSMLKADTVWEPDQSLEFPMTMEAASNVIAALMDIAIDERSAFNSTYTVDYPANDYTLRDVLKYIAAAHGGNWIVTREDKLLLVPLVGGAPAETFNLITESGDTITFGGDSIRV